MHGWVKAAKGIDLDAKECIGIEDSKAGIDAIKRAGMLSVGVGNPETVKDADVILKDLSNPQDIIKLLNTNSTQ